MIENKSSIDRAFAVLEHLADRAKASSILSLSKELGIPRNSMYRICESLIRRGYLKQHSSDGQVVITRKLFSLGYRALSETNLVELARPAMQSLRDEFGETVLIGTLMDGEGAVLEEIAGTHHFNFRVQAGARFQLHCTAPGKVLMAFLPKAEQASLVDALDLVAHNQRTITAVPELLRELDEIRVRGVGYDFAEQIEGCHCVGAPVLNAYGYPVAAIWITGPSVRLTEHDLAEVGEELGRLTRKLSMELGHLMEDKKS